MMSNSSTGTEESHNELLIVPKKNSRKYSYQRRKCFHVVILVPVAFLFCWVNAVRGFSLEQKRHNFRTRQLNSNLYSHPDIIINSVSGEESPIAGAQYSIEKEKLNQEFPRHVAFICDGNSRWAKAQNLPKFFGHSRGGYNLISLILHLVKNYKSQVQYATFYAFSTENWSRSADEINALWIVIEQVSREFHKIAIREGILVRILGDWRDERIPDSLQTTLEFLEKDTAISAEKRGKNLTVCIAINYGGRADILNAALKLADSIVKGEINIEDTQKSKYEATNENNVAAEKSIQTKENNCKPNVSAEDMFDQYLCTNGVPDPDLLIRTGGQQRLSNFLLWNVAYSELFFSPFLWPEFNEKQLDGAIEWFRGSQRRYGGR